ncbi:MAG: glycoside hydrolase [Kiritimatiellia bacterium]
MKFRINILMSAAMALAAIADAAPRMDIAKPTCWARDAKALVSRIRDDGSVEIIHSGPEDWNVGGAKTIQVKPGDTFMIRASSEALPSNTKSGTYTVSAVVLDAGGSVIEWNYGARTVRAGEIAETRFMVPPNAAAITPRIVGRGETSLVVTGFEVEPLGNMMPPPDAAKNATIRTEALEVTVSGDDASLSVKDLRTGRLWQSGKRANLAVTGIAKTARTIRVDFIETFSLRRRQAFVSPLPALPEVLVTVTGEGEMGASLHYPNAFETRAGDRLIVPMNEGISYPAEDPDGIPHSLAGYSGHGICMSFFGVQDDKSPRQDGYMAIIETADDAAAVFAPPRKGAAISPGVCWEPQNGAFGYPRRVRLVFFDKGGYVAMAKRYRAWAKSQGRLKTFAEKEKERPLVDRLLGAPNIWCRTGKTVEYARKLKEAGIDRFLWSNRGSAAAVAELAKMDGVLVSRYDVYRDIYHPEQLKKLGWTTGANTDAWPEGVAWNSADPNDWRKAWPVKAKDGTWTYCACMCDAVSGKYCRDHVTKELATHPYNTRFIDVTTASGWDTCYNPAHPMTRTDSKTWRMDLLRLLGDDFGLVVGSETGHDAAVPYCDYFEGMLSLGNYRVPDSGRHLEQIWTNVPPRVAKFQVGAAYRLPLWELVYHDCVCAHWYWGDYNNKLPSLWDKRDLFNVLYGTMGMYYYLERDWERLKDRFVQSYRMTSPVARRTGKSEMLNHEILSPDRMLQRTVFADGTVVTVNFGEKELPLPEGGTLEAGGHLVSSTPIRR